MKRFSIFAVIFLVAVVASLPVGPGWANGGEAHETEEARTISEKESSNLTHEDTHEHGTKASSDHHGASKALTGEGHADQPASEDTEHHDSSQKLGLLKTLLPGLTEVPDIHPMLVHFPIVFLWGTFVFVVGSWFWKPDFFLSMGRWLFWLGLISLPITAGTGFLAVGGWGGGHVTTHRNLMLITTALAFVLFAVLRYVSNRQRLYRVAMTVGLLIVLAFMTLGADRGAWLVYVEGSGVKPVKQTHNH